MFRFYLIIFSFLLLAAEIFAQPNYDISIDNNWVNISVDKFETHCLAEYSIDFSIQSNIINIVLNDTSDQKCKSKCNIEMEIDIYQIPQGNYTLNIFTEDNNLLNSRDNRKLIYKKEVKISSNFAKSPLAYNFRHSTCNNNESLPVNGLEVYPNPGNSKLTIKFDLKSRADVNFKVLNFLGKEVLSYDKKSMSAGIQVLNIESDNLQPGMYIGKLTASNGQVFSVKILWSR